MRTFHTLNVNARTVFTIQPDSRICSKIFIITVKRFLFVLLYFCFVHILCQFYIYNDLHYYFITAKLGWLFFGKSLCGFGRNFLFYYNKPAVVQSENSPNVLQLAVIIGAFLKRRNLLILASHYRKMIEENE